MLDIKRIRQNPEALVEAMRKRRNKGARCHRPFGAGRKAPGSNAGGGAAQGKAQRGLRQSPRHEEGGRGHHRPDGRNEGAGRKGKGAGRPDSKDGRGASVHAHERAEYTSRVRARRGGRQGQRGGAPLVSSPRGSTSSPRRIGTSARTWAYWTSPPQAR